MCITELYIVFTITCQNQYLLCVYLTGPVYITRSPGGGTSFTVAESVTLTCMVSGSPMSYSWSRTCTGCNDSDLTGIDQSVLTVATVRARDTGSYTCTVTDGGTTMSTATISRVEGKNTFCTCTCLIHSRKKAVFSVNVQYIVDNIEKSYWYQINYYKCTSIGTCPTCRPHYSMGTNSMHL